MTSFDFPAGVNSYTVGTNVPFLTAGEYLFQAVGGGGGGRGGIFGQGGAGGGGGAAYQDHTQSLVVGDVVQVTRGTGGAGSAYNSGSSVSGTATIVKVNGVTVCSADFGLRSTSGTGGLGGQAANCIGNGTATNGQSGADRSVSNPSPGGNGGQGAAPLGGAGGLGTGSLGGSGTAPGGGGAGGGNTNGAGGAGAVGLARVSYFTQYGFQKVAGDVKKVVDLWFKPVGETIRKASDGNLLPYVAQGGVLKPAFWVAADDSAFARAVPDYVPTGHESKFDTMTGAFNFNTGNSSRIASSLANADTLGANHVFIGDSISEGYTSLTGIFPFYTITADRLHAFPLMYRDKIAELRSIAVGGTGLVRAKSVQTYTDSRWTGSSSWAGPGHWISSATASAAFTSDLAGTAVRLYAFDRSPMRITIDGVDKGTIDGGGTLTPTVHEWTGLANTTHTVSVARNTGGQNAGLRGCEVYNPGLGLRIHNLAQGGATAAGTGQPAWSDISSGFDNQLPTYTAPADFLGDDPDVVFVMLGGNDINDTAPSVIAAALETIGLTFPNSDVVLILTYQGSTTFAAPALYPPFWEAIMQCALDNDWPLIDAQFITGGYNSLDAQGYAGDSFGHLSASGAAFFGEAVATAIHEAVA